MASMASVKEAWKCMVGMGDDLSWIEVYQC
jgi:hypothetical protein